MGLTQWNPIDALDPERFGSARHQVHSAVLWLARLASSYGGEADPSLLWHAGRRAITTRALEGDLGMELILPELILTFTEHGVPVRHDFELEGHTQAHVEAWILVELLHRDVDRTRFSKALPYDVSALMTGDAIEFSPEAYTAELEALAGWYEHAMANRAGEATIWPQDLALDHPDGAAPHTAPEAAPAR